MSSVPEQSADLPIKKNRKVKYRKPPQAPRRFKSAYMFFSTEKHREIRERLKNLGKEEKTTNIAKMVSLEWKAISIDEKRPWDEMARKDKARYDLEKSMYTGPWRVPSAKRSSKNPSAPRRPMSAFLSFAQGERSKVRDQHPTKTNTEVSRLLSQMWKEAPDEIRNHHIELEKTRREDYKVKMSEWKENHEKELAGQRQKREENVLAAIRAGVRPIDREGHGPIDHATLSATGVSGLHPGVSMQYTGNQPIYYEGDPMGAYPYSAYDGYPLPVPGRGYRELDQDGSQRMPYGPEGGYVGDPYAIQTGPYQEAPEAMYQYYPPQTYVGTHPQFAGAAAQYDQYYGSAIAQIHDAATNGGSHSLGGSPGGYAYPPPQQPQQHPQEGDYPPQQYGQY